MIAPAAILAAGGLVPVQTKLGKDDAVDVVVARAYRHGVLPGRTIVRLTAENVAAGDDLEMATLGFGAGEDRGPVGKERKRPLGFPGWALVHDPKNARFALDVVKEFKKQARKARTKPGHAKEGLETIAERLGKSVPHFLPSFYEEAGRVFIEYGAPTFAAAMFGKAREAEAVHALAVDEQHRVDAFLEFALAGAVTTKALAQYAKELAEHHEPGVAYAHFRQLCVQRTLGGMPPWTGMAKELRRLAKAAELDPDAEDAGFVAEIIASPALGKAAGEFWRAYGEPLAQLGRRSAAARGVLLNLFPTGTAYNADLDQAWLDLLEATGAVDALISDQVAPEAAASGGRAAWFDKLLHHLSRAWRVPIDARALQLLRRMAPMLIVDGAPIHGAGRSGRMDLDIVELALELGVAVEPPAERAAIDLAEWAKNAGEPERGRDPVLTAAHPTLAPLLAAAVAASIGGEPFDTASRGKQGLLAAKRAWLEAALVHAEQGALPGVEDALALVNTKVKPETFAELPDLHARFAALDLAPALARTLRIGIIDELGWPALEAAFAELTAGPREPTVHGGPPALVVVGQTRAIAVGPRGRLAEHDLVIPPKHELFSVRFIDGQLLVLLKGEVYRLRAYWSGAPHDVFDTELSEYSVARRVDHAAVLADGAWIESTRPMRAGDRKLSFGTGLRASDGTTSWTSEWKDGVLRWREITASGEAGRFSWPPFIEAGLDGEWRVDAASYVFPAPGGVTESPLGVADGLVGARIRYLSAPGRRQVATQRELVMIDGTAWHGPPAVEAACVVRLPGGGAPRPVLVQNDWRATTTTILDEAGAVRGSRLGSKDRRYLRGQPAALTPGFWHALVARDEAGSQQLRATNDAAARALMAAVPVQTGTPAAVSHPEPQDVTGGVLAIGDARLRAGVTGLAVMAVQLGLERDRLVAERAPSLASGRATSPGHGDVVLQAGLAGWIERESPYGRAWAQIERAAEVWASVDRTDRVIHAVPNASLDWLPFAVARWSLAYIACAIGTPAAHRRAVVDLLAHLTALLPPADKLRVYRGEGALEGDTKEWNQLELRWRGGNAYVIRRLRSSQFRVLEYAPGGTFAALPELAIADELRGGASPTNDDVAAVMTAVASGKTSWAPERGERLAAATGLTPSEATFLVAGSPNGGSHENNFLDKELRETLGLKAAHAMIARDSLKTVPLMRRLAVIDEAARVAGARGLVEGEALVDALAAAWNRLVGVRATIPEDLVAEADHELQAPMKPSHALAMIAAAAEAPQLNADGMWGLDAQGEPIRVAAAAPLVGQEALEDAPPVFDAPVMFTLASYVPFLYAELPVGHALRASAAVAYDRALARLANPALWLDAGKTYVYDEATKATMARLVEAIGGEVVCGLHAQVQGRRIPGAIVTYGGYQVALRLHPASLDGAAVATVRRIAEVVSQWGESTWHTLSVLRSPDTAAIVARIRETPVPDGGFEQAPLASASALVDRVVRALGVSREAAALYLQFLALMWPTPKNVMLWNGWKAKQLEAATGELVERGLLLEAKRERAQRSHFLPGGWEPGKPPHPPRETWKVPLYTAADGHPAPLRRYLPLAPFHVLFERAWQRVEAGDVPRYEEVVR